MELGIAREGLITEEARAEMVKWLGVTIPLALLVLLIRQFQLESGGFIYVAFIAFFGFVVHSLLPLRYRLPFFAVLSLAGIAIVMGPRAGLWLITVGLVLIGICHIPVSYWVRVAMLLGTGGLLVVFRHELLPYPWTSAIWPILGSMFMFRLLIYMYDLRHDRSLQTPSSTLAYFFMLPNVVAPLFPVVDYRTFRRTYYNEEAYTIYHRGITWMFRGVIHLMLYRFVYFYLTLSPAEVQTTGDLAQFVVTNYLLYLRISGLFHLFIGMMLLFGFNLPETNHHWLLASSFTDYWRRINIYWKDFMMKIFYYPSFFWFRRLGSTAALVLATLVVFLVTMILHSYQWYWIRGAFVLSTPDAVFWSILAVFVVTNAVWESKRGRKRTLAKHQFSFGDFSVRAAKTVATFTVITVLWSLWMSTSLDEWLSLWKVFDGSIAFDGKLVPALIVLGVAVGTTLGNGSPDKEAPKNGQHPVVALWRRAARLQHSRIWMTGVLVVLLVGTHPRVLDLWESPAATTLNSLRQPRLNRQDQALLERGYYENLLGVERFNAELWKLYAKRPSDWRDLWQTEALRTTDDFLGTELAPSIQITYKAAEFTTNRWGMRDQDYARAKPAGTYRIGMVGASPVLGSGVENEETFEALLEARLNEDHRDGPFAGYEILNFASEGYGAPTLVRLAEAKALSFEPDALFYVDHEVSAAKAIEDLARRVADTTEIIYPELQEIVNRAGAEPGMEHGVLMRLLGPFTEEVMGWAYRRVVQDAVARGALPVWVFIPMPTAGGMIPCPPDPGPFCFGSVAKMGAAAGREDPRVNTLFRLANEAGFITLDLSGVFDGYDDMKSFWIAQWDGHPNADAHRLIANRLYEVLQGNTGDLSEAMFRGPRAMSTSIGGTTTNVRD
jgi:hypothetical protein